MTYEYVLAPHTFACFMINACFLVKSTLNGSGGGSKIKDTPHSFLVVFNQSSYQPQARRDVTMKSEGHYFISNLTFLSHNENLSLHESYFFTKP
jgi:hypothetical protein